MIRIEIRYHKSGRNRKTLYVLIKDLEISTSGADIAVPNDNDAPFDHLTLPSQPMPTMFN